MLIRYKTSEHGKPIRQAKIFTQNEHGIDRSHIDRDAIKIVLRLQNSGYEAYIVGGAVRDILLGKTPKDFDIATNATPSRIKKLFRNSRIIGKRFRLVHVFFHNRKIIEVSTFRSGTDNSYGDIDDDVCRRDFSVNALYYDPARGQLVDFVNGFADLKKRRLRSPIPLGNIFIEDPVRIIRALKYMARGGFKANFLLSARMKRDTPLLRDISYSRITEEIYKILESGCSSAIFAELINYKITRYIMPAFDSFLRSGNSRASTFLASLGELDTRSDRPRAILLQYLVRDYVTIAFQGKKAGTFHKVYESVKKVLQPMSPANRDVEEAVLFLIHGQNPPKGNPKGKGRDNPRRRNHPRARGRSRKRR